MIRNLLALIICSLLLSTSYASPIHRASVAEISPPYAGSFIRPANSVDNWLGGTGNWSDPTFWITGLPTSSSDVVIDSGGTDLVYLDMSPTIASLTLGGNDSGSAQLVDNGTAQMLTILGALTINQTGTLYLANNDAVIAGADSSNAGYLQLDNGSTLTVNGNFSNTGSMNVGSDTIGGGPSQASFAALLNTGYIDVGLGSRLTVAGDLTNNGGIGLDGVTQLTVGGSMVNNGSLTTGQFWAGDQIQVAGGMTNSGEIVLRNDTQLIVNGAATNSGTIYLIGEDPEIIGSHALFGSLVNSGTIQVGYGSGFASADVTNTGTIKGDVADVGWFQAGNLNNSGSIALAGFDASGNVNNSGSIRTILATVGGNLVNSGNLAIFGETDFQLGLLSVQGNVTNSGLIDLERGTNTINIAGKLLNTPTGTFSLERDGNVVNVSSIVNQGTLSVGYLGSLNVTGGPRAIGNALAGLVNSGTVDIQQYGNLNVVGNYTQTAGQTTVGGTLQLQGNGGAIFADGTVYGEGGTIDGSVLSNAEIHPDPLFINGNYTQGLHGSLTFDIAGAALGEYDQLNISGHAQLNGLATVDLLHGFVPAVGNEFDIMNFASHSGTFSMVVGLPINSQEHFVLEYNSTDLTLDVVSGPASGPNAQPGWIASKSSSEPFIGTDGQLFSMSPSQSRAGAPSQTPEPGSLLLLASGLLCAAGGLRRRSMK